MVDYQTSPTSATKWNTLTRPPFYVGIVGKMAVKTVCVWGGCALRLSAHKLTVENDQKHTQIPANCDCKIEKKLLYRKLIRLKQCRNMPHVFTHRFKLEVCFTIIIVTVY